MFDKMRKGAFLLMLAGLAVATLTGSPAGAASSQPAVSAAVVDRVAAPAGPWRDEWDAPMAILYNQLDNPGTNSFTSQNFEAAYDAYDGFGGDDFVVPANTSWTIKGVGVNGQYTVGGGPAASFNVFFHTDLAGLPKDPPAATRASQAYVEDPPGFFKIMLSPSITIPASPSPRHVWVSVQANLDFIPPPMARDPQAGGQWFWGDRAVQSNDAAAWKNPGNGFQTGCTTWGTLATCLASVDPDFQFGLVGTHTP